MIKIVRDRLNENKISNAVNKTIVLDFDGVIHSYKNGWTGDIPEEEPNPGTEEALKAFNKMGYEIVVSSVRKAKYIVPYLEKWGLDNYISYVTNDKPPGVIYIDDKGLRFQNWEQILNDINEFL